MCVYVKKVPNLEPFFATFGNYRNRQAGLLAISAWGEFWHSAGPPFVERPPLCLPQNHQWTDPRPRWPIGLEGRPTARTTLESILSLSPTLLETIAAAETTGPTNFSRDVATFCTDLLVVTRSLC